MKLSYTTSPVILQLDKMTMRVLKRKFGRWATYKLQLKRKLGLRV